MEIRLLRYFWAVAQEGNITRAAKTLNITQPTLSRQMKELEESIGAPLFKREKNKIYLTKDGQFLKERAEEILTLDDKLEQAFIKKDTINLSGNVSIGCVEADNSDTVAMMLEEMISEYPLVTFNLVTGTGDDIIDKLEKGILDIAVLLNPISVHGVEYLTLPREEKWGFIVSKDKFPELKDKITANDIVDLPILTSNRREIKTLLTKWIDSEEGKPNVIGNFNLIFNVLPLIEDGIAAALTIEGAAKYHLTQNTVFTPLYPEVKTNCILVWKKRVHTPAVEKLIEKFKHAF